MLSDITNSIKAKLYDFTYTPFMSSMIIAWIILNHKYLLIYFAEYGLDEKLELLNEHDFSYVIGTVCIPYAMNVWFPIAFGLFYVFVYPWASKIFYEYTLERTKALKKVKQKIEDETPITQEEAHQIRYDIEKLTRERDEQMEKALKAEAYYEKKYKERVDELNNNEEGDDSATGEDSKVYFKVQNELTEDNDKSSPEHSQTPLLINESSSSAKENDKRKILRFFYESNYKPQAESYTLDNIVNKTQIPRPKAQKILDALILEKTLNRTTDSYKIVSITPKGNSILIEMFDEEE